MNFRVRAGIWLVVALIAFPQLMKAPVVFKPTEQAKYVAPGEEELSGNAKELFEIGQKAEKEGNLKRAISAYKTLARRHAKDALASGALYRAAELQEKLHIYIPAAETYRMVVEKYPTNPHFNDAIEAQFRVGEIYLGGRKLKILGIPMASALDRAVEIFAAVVRTAPYGKYTARAQFDIGLAREKQGANDAALQAYQAVVDKFPNEPLAAAAQYQIGYIWFTAARAGTKDIAATTNARTAFQDFLFRYPNSEKAGQARSNLKLLEGKQITSSLKVAQFYDKQKNFRAAVIYYNEVIRQQPGSRESEEAQKRIDQLRAKLGDAALQPEFVAAEAEKKKQQSEKEKPGALGEGMGKPASAAGESSPSGTGLGGSTATQQSTLPSNETKLPTPTQTPAPARAVALPPASLGSANQPVSQTDTSATPGSAATPEATPTPEPSLTPEASGSPAP